MFHNKDNITAVLAMIVLLAAPVALAQNGDPASAKPAPKKQAAKQASTAKKANTPTPVSVPAPPTVTLEAATDDSAEAVKLRSSTGNPLAGKLKSELCQGCHGEVGISPASMFPNLAGQYSKYIVKQIQNFQAGTRRHQIMTAIAASISDDDLPDIANYFASRTKMKGEIPSDNPIGKNLFLNGDMSRMIVGCVNCHGDNGKGKTPINAVFPVIGGQNKDYVVGQLNNFKAGERINSPGGVMNIIAQKMTATEIDAVGEYVSGL